MAAVLLGGRDFEEKHTSSVTGKKPLKVKSDHRSKFSIGMKKPENIRASVGFEPVTSAIPVGCSTN